MSMTESKTDEIKLPASLAIVLLWACLLLDGWAIHIMWRWFVVPIGITAIGVFQAMGIDILLATFRGKKPGSGKVHLSDITWAATRTLTYLGFAWIVHRFMVAS